MRMVDLIQKKRDGLILSRQEIEYVINGYTKDIIPDYQMSAFLMAIYFQGMDLVETSALTLAMADSGARVDLRSVKGVKVDKHSTGGVADTTTLVVMPMIAAAGVVVAKMSGRGLGFTGGTIDKLESIPGFVTTLSQDNFISQLQKHGMAITGQSSDLAPADGKIYALRDVTATVSSIPLIASSIMSKKIASGADKILLDVKVGSGAFMESFEQAVELAEAMVAIGRAVKRETRAIITSMEEPLGYAIGNALEVQEAIGILSGKGSERLRDVCLILGAHLLQMAAVEKDLDKGYLKLKTLLENGMAMEKFKELIVIQQGDAGVVDDLSMFPTAVFHKEVKSSKKGYITSMQTAKIGNAAAIVGAGRMVKGQEIDLSAGIMMHCRIGDFVHEGDVLAVIHGNDSEKMEQADVLFLEAINIEPDRVDVHEVILGVVDADGFHPK